MNSGLLSDIIQSLWAMVPFSIGLSMIFGKCKEKRWTAFLPCYRQYKLGVCAGREKEGAILGAQEFYAIVFSALGNIYEDLVNSHSRVAALFTMLSFALVLARIIYSARVYRGLCRRFDRDRKWIWLFVLFQSTCALIWGFSKKFQPRDDLDMPQAEGTALSGVTKSAIEKGLTVNIEERTAGDLFQRKVLLRDIHITIPAGHMVLLLGGSGAGKTTFINAVTGYEKAKAKIELDGKDLYRDYDQMKYEVGLVPQQELMRGNDTVLRTLNDAAILRLPDDVTDTERKQRVHKVLDIFGLTPVEHSLVEKLSGGQKKRLSTAMEFVSDPTLFILDEPDSGLDGIVARSLFQRLREIADEGKIVLVITHTPDRVIDLFDDVIVLAKDSHRTGRLAYYGPVEEAYRFFGKDSMEDILLSINQKEEGGEGRAEEFVASFAGMLREEMAV